MTATMSSCSLDLATQALQSALDDDMSSRCCGAMAMLKTDETCPSSATTRSRGGSPCTEAFPSIEHKAVLPSSPKKAMKVDSILFPSLLAADHDSPSYLRRCCA